MPAILRQPPLQIRQARQQRRDLSLPEVLLWRELRKRPGGYKFRRLVPQQPYTLDFACLAARLAIEVDGQNHDFGDRPRRDTTRDAVMAERGFRTWRIAAADVLGDIDACIVHIVEACRERFPPPPSLRDGPPPRSGED